MARILVIDDDHRVRSFITAALAESGHSVLEAADGAAGIKLLKAGNFELVLCDIFMPNQEGLETIQLIRNLRQTLPVIAMSGGSDLCGDFLSIAKKLGASEALQKPIPLEALRSTVAHFVTR